MGLKKDLLNETVSTLPLREPVTVPSGTIVRAAIAQMKSKSLGCAVVVDYAGKPLGTFTERSVIELLLSDPTVLDRQTVADHLDPKWIVVKQSDPVAEVLNAMQSKDQRFAVVVDEEGQVVGLTGQKGLMECIADYFPEQVFCQRVGTPPVSARRSLEMKKGSQLDEFQDPLENYEPPVFNDSLEQALAEEPIGSIQCAPFARIAPDASVREAVQLLGDMGVGCLVVMEGPRLVGLFSERDVLNKVAENFEKTGTLPVSELMTKKIMSVEDSDPAGAALCLMAAFGYRHAPVLGSKGEVVGIVSPQRMLEFLQRYLAKE